MEGLAQLHAQLRTALGSTAFPGPGCSAKPDGVRNLSQRSAVSVRRHVAEPDKPVAAATRFCVGHLEGRQVSAAWERGNLLRAAKHAVAGGFDYNERRAATDDLPQHADHFVRRARTSLAQRRDAAVQRCPLRRGPNQ